MPKVGDIEQGYRYRGGDPWRKESWIPIEGQISDMSKEQIFTEEMTMEPDATGYLSKNAKENRQKVFDMAGMSSGIVKFSKKFDKVVDAADSLRNKSFTEGAATGDEFLYVPGNKRIPIGKDMNPDFDNFDRHSRAAKEIYENDLYKSFETKNKGEPLYVNEVALTHYLENEDAIRGAGGGAYKIGEITDKKIQYIKKDFLNKNVDEYSRQLRDTNGLRIDSAVPNTGVEISLEIPANKVRSLDPENAKKFNNEFKKVTRDALKGRDAKELSMDEMGVLRTKADDLAARLLGPEAETFLSFGPILSSKTPLTKARQIRTMVDDFVKTGGDAEKYDAISDLLKELIERKKK
jgi:hypothetical protein